MLVLDNLSLRWHQWQAWIPLSSDASWSRWGLFPSIHDPFIYRCKPARAICEGVDERHSLRVVYGSYPVTTGEIHDFVTATASENEHMNSNVLSFEILLKMCVNKRFVEARKWNHIAEVCRILLSRLAFRLLQRWLQRCV